MENQDSFQNTEGSSAAPFFNQRLDLSPVRDAVDAVKRELAKVIIGQDELMDLLNVALLCDGHVLLEGVPGIAKTMTAKLLARTIAAGFSRIQFTPDLMPSDVVGTMIFKPKRRSFISMRDPFSRTSSSSTK